MEITERDKEMQGGRRACMRRMAFRMLVGSGPEDGWLQQELSIRCGGYLQELQRGNIIKRYEIIKNAKKSERCRKIMFSTSSVLLFFRISILGVSSAVVLIN